jgi:hypothetical protein
VARLLAAGMRLVFLQLGQPLPPWRERRALLSKWLPEVYSDEVIPLQPLPDQNAGIAAMLAPYQRSFRASLASIMCGAGPSAAVGSNGAQPQQHLQHNSSWPATRLEQQGPVGEGQARPAGCLHAAVPAGRPATSVSLLRSALAQTPQKVVIGFPEQQQDPPQPQQQQQQQPWRHVDDPGYSGGLWDAPCKRSHTPDSPRSPPPASPTAAVRVRVEVDVGKGKAGPAAPATRAVFSINVAAAAAVDSSSEVAEMDQTVRNGGRPAMATTQLAAMASKGAAGSAATQQQQQQQQQQGDAAAATLEVQAANAAAAAGMAAAATAAGVAAAAAAAAASSGVGTRPGFKSLDQLLPRMRTVRPRAQ